MEIHRLTGVKLSESGKVLAYFAAAGLLYYLWKKSKK
jgi:hypothetical protein